MSQISFRQALQKKDISLTRQVPKADLHNHSLLGARLETYFPFAGKPLAPPPRKMRDIQDMHIWISENINPYFASPAGIISILENTFRQAQEDGVTVLETSTDLSHQIFFPGGAEELVYTLQDIHNRIAPEIDYRPEMGIARHAYPLDQASEWMDNYLSTGYFRSLDLYADELPDPVEWYAPLYRKAQQAGLKLKAHYGEFGDADSVKKAVETLELDEVQHGIAAAESPSVMNWLVDHHIQLNICPSSNVALSRVDSLKTHPIRKLFDAGIKVTVNTDDVCFFDQSVSEEFLNLYRAELFSPEELDTIRRYGLGEM